MSNHKYLNHDCKLINKFVFIVLRSYLRTILTFVYKFIYICYSFSCSISGNLQWRKWQTKTQKKTNFFSLLIPLSHLNVLVLYYLILVSFKQTPCDKVWFRSTLQCRKIWWRGWIFPSVVQVAIWISRSRTVCSESKMAS